MILSERKPGRRPDDAKLWRTALLQAAGWTDAEIAAKLHETPGAVNSRSVTIRRYFKVRNRTELSLELQRRRLATVEVLLKLRGLRR